EQLVVVEVQVGINLVALEQVVADGDLAEEVALAERGLLAMARQGEEELYLERRAGAAGVEVGEERILPLLGHHRRVQTRAQPMRQRGLADAGWPFDRYVSKLAPLSREYRVDACCASSV